MEDCNKKRDVGANHKNKEDCMACPSVVNNGSVPKIPLHDFGEPLLELELQSGFGASSSSSAIGELSISSARVQAEWLIRQV